MSLVTGWLNVMELTRPKHLVVAEDVQAGKPGKYTLKMTDSL